MTASVSQLLIALAVLTTKHVAFDFFLQSIWQVRAKRIYGHPGGLVHAAGHAAGTCLVFLVIAPSIPLGIAIVFAEFALHYHIDWLKEKIAIRTNLGPDQQYYWWAFGVDQWLHHMTYVAILAVLAST